METPRKVLRGNNEPGMSCTPLKVPASPLLKHLGYGTGVNVYFLERSPRSTGQARSPWAIKRVSQRTRITNNSISKVFNERILKEADILRKLKHPNIVGFRALDKKSNAGGMDTLALECCSTSLGTILEERLDNDESALPANFIKRMLIDVANALDYLHTEAMLLHGDLKSHNVLVKGDFEICKLCDFGVSLPLSKEGLLDFRENPHLAYVGTNLWCAPEVIAEEEVIDCKSDIFSLGLVIYETISLRPPHMDSGNAEEKEENSNDETVVELDESEASDVAQMSEIDMAYGTRPALPEAFELGEEYNIVLELFYICTNDSVAERPTAKIIYDALKNEDDRETTK